MKRFLIAAVFAALAHAGCSDSPVVPEESGLVLQAYLYAGLPVTDITLTMSRPFSSVDTMDVPVADASVVLIRGDVRYALTPVAADPGRYAYTGTGLDVREGDRFRIEITRDGAVTSAETTVPGRPQGLRASLDTLHFVMDSITTPMGGTRYLVTTTDTLELRWDNSSRVAHYVVVESVDPARAPLVPDSTRLPIGMRFVNEPTVADFYRPMPFTFRYTGRHRLLVYRVNQEYLDLYSSRQQDSRTLNEPLTNVRNGLGIFTAFNCDSVFVEIVL